MDEPAGSPGVTRPTPEESIRDTIAREEATIVRPEGELKEARAVLESLRADPAAGRPAPPNASAFIRSRPAPVTCAETVTLLRFIFRGREDFHPKLWTNAVPVNPRGGRASEKTPYVHPDGGAPG